MYFLPIAAVLTVLLVGFWLYVLNILRSYTTLEMELREYFVGRAFDPTELKNATVGWLMPGTLAALN